MKNDTLWQIRPAQAKDLAAITALAGEVFSIYGNYREYLPYWASVPQVDTLVAEVAGELIAFLMLIPLQDQKPPYTRYADVLAIAISPKYQRQGLGTQLLNFAVKIAREQRGKLKLQELRLTVADTNIAAQTLFQHMGFKFSQEPDGLYEGGQKALRMYHPLDDD
jgi:ribosomal protein S18 acetylase RimI-like enzyme